MYFWTIMCPISVDRSYEPLEANRGIKMRIETMKDIGLFLIVLGIMSMVTGTYIIYSSFDDYSQCALAPNSVCQVTAPIFIRFLTRQQYGNSAAFYGLVFMVVGAIFYVTAQTKKTELVAANPNAAKT